MTGIVAGGTTALQLGAKAWMTELNNFIPEIAMFMHKLAIIENNWSAARKAYFEKILPLQDCRKPIGKLVSVVKYALEHRGFQVGQRRKPPRPLSEKLKEAARKTLEAIVIF